MKLKSLLKGLEGLEVKGSKEVEITGLTDDSRTAAPGHLFIARKGFLASGADFIRQALDAGSVAVLTDLYDPFCRVTQLIVEKPEMWGPLLARRFYGAPSTELFVVGVTGTKGKTTTTYLIHHLLNGLGRPAGLVGSVEMLIGNERRPSLLTTHNAIHNQKLLKEMLAKNCTSVSFEVSSHGLAQRRVEGIDFDVAVFTNLYPDHFDYHPTLEDYAMTKRTLFANVKQSIFNADSEWTPFMREGCTSPILTFGIEQKADIRAEVIRCSEAGTHFAVDGQPFFLPILGRFNVYNALGAIAVGLHLGASLSSMAAILARFQTVPGRLERVENDRGLWIFVDHAHTGAALEHVLIALRALHKRIICVFGAGGNRDPQRRIQMAKAAEQYADVSIITSDNPRSEDPASICEQIRNAYSDPSKPIVEVQRKSAIHLAIAMAEPGDIVLIAGKGHEKTQIFAHQTIPFDDVLIAKQAT